eukprot:scaffold32766_cov58-Attheya_sp.AAC.3
MAEVDLKRPRDRWLPGCYGVHANPNSATRANTVPFNSLSTVHRKRLRGAYAHRAHDILKLLSLVARLNRETKNDTICRLRECGNLNGDCRPLGAESKAHRLITSLLNRKATRPKAGRSQD